MSERLEKIRQSYLGQPVREFVDNGGDPREYAQLVFDGAIFGPGQEVTDEALGIRTVNDLTDALQELVDREHAARQARLAALEQHRAGTQFQPLDSSSPTVVLQVRIPKHLLNVVDLLAHTEGESRSEYVRGLIHKAASEADITGSLFADADALHAKLQAAGKRRKG